MLWPLPPRSVPRNQISGRIFYTKTFGEGGGAGVASPCRNDIKWSILVAFGIFVIAGLLSSRRKKQAQERCAGKAGLRATRKKDVDGACASFTRDDDRIQLRRTVPAKKLGKRSISQRDALRLEARKCGDPAVRSDNGAVRQEMLELAAICDEVANLIEDQMTPGRLRKPSRPTDRSWIGECADENPSV